MTNIFDPGHFELEQVRAILQGMLRVASSDGDDAREIALISEFLEASRPDVRASLVLEELRGATFDLERSRAALTTSSLKQTFVASCLLVAYSDGRVSDAEQATVAALVRELAIDDETVSTVQQRVEGLLVQRVAQVSDLAALRSISGQL